MCSDKFVRNALQFKGATAMGEDTNLYIELNVAIALASASVHKAQASQ